jgi:ribosomal-protein-alanine N-acetyltransferase
MIIPTLTNSHLSLCPLQSGDAVLLHSIYQQEGVLKYFPSPTPPPLERLDHFVNDQQSHWQTHGYGNWGILPAGEQEIIGWAGLQYLPELDETELGFLLARPFWGKGLATEAARLSTQFGFETCCLDHLVALVYPENHASQAVLNKTNYQYIETIPLWGIQLMRCKLDRMDYDHQTGERSTS